MSTGHAKTWLTQTPELHGEAQFARPNGSSAFARRSRSPNPTALLLSVIITGALIGILLLVSGVTDRVRPVTETLVMVPLAQISADDADLPTEKPVDQPEVFADSADEAAPSSRPRTVTPAPALPVAPPAAINLAPVVPHVPVSGEGLETLSGATSEGDLAQGPIGRGGNGGDGVAGDGSGGAGSGKGKGSKLIASWAPSMDFSQNHRFYPPEARKAGVEGTVLLDCYVLPRDRVRDCKLVAEKPSGYGFGESALKTERGFRVRIHNQAGRRFYHRRVNVISYFVLPESESRRASAESKTGDDKVAP